MFSGGCIYNLYTDDVTMTAQRILPEDDTLVLKHVAAINKEQYNKLSIECAFVCSFYI
jgi:hypothetical protein